MAHEPEIDPREAPRREDAQRRFHRDLVAARLRRPPVRPQRFPYLRWGIAAGAIGAFAVALLFFVLDLLAGRPFATPTALGASLFLREPFSVAREPQAVLVLAYTAVHAGLFVAFGTAVCATLLGGTRLPRHPFAAGSTLAALFFAGTTAACFGLSLGFGLPLWNDLGVGSVLAANALAAIAMAALLTAAFLRAGAPRAELRKPIDARELPARPVGRTDAGRV